MRLCQVILERYKVEYKHAGYGLSDKKYMELTSQWLKRLGEAQRDTRFKLTTLTVKKTVKKAPPMLVERPTVYCSDFEGLLQYLLEMGLIDPDEMEVLVGFDDGRW